MSVSGRKKDDQNTNTPVARVKLRWMELDVEGGTANLVEGFKSFATELTRGASAVPRTNALSSKKTDTNTSTSVIDTPVVEGENVDAIDGEPTDEILPDPTISNGDSRPKRRPAPKAPRFLNELDLTKATVQLADFVREKNPEGDMDKYAVIAVWFKQHLNTEEVSIDHIFTAYKALGWQAQLPTDLSQTFRNLKSNKNWLDSGSTRGAYKINWNGEGSVNKMGAVKP